MGLLTIIKKVKRKEKEMRLLILSAAPLLPLMAHLWVRRGLDNAGKTSVMQKFNGEDISGIEPTLGFNIKSLEYRG